MVAHVRSYEQPAARDMLQCCLLTCTPTALISKVLIHVARDALNAHVYEELA